MSSLLTSYLTPILSGYLDRYIKDIAPEDLQVSLWGGDVVLKNLELRLDVLESELGLPLQRGCIRKLTIHVPWSALSSEPVVVTIDTIEIELATNGCNEHPSSQSEGKPTQSDAPLAAPSIPAILEGTVSRVMHNLQIQVNNLVLKYERNGQMVLSLNIKSLELGSTNERWDPSFVEVTAPHFLLHRLVKVSELTVCLDRLAPSGTILYEAPLIDRCCLECRLRLTFASAIEVAPVIAQVNVGTALLKANSSPSQVAMATDLIEALLQFIYGDEAAVVLRGGLSRSASQQSLSSMQGFLGDTKLAAAVAAAAAADVEAEAGGSGADQGGWFPSVWSTASDESSPTPPTLALPTLDLRVLNVGIFVESVQLTIMMPDGGGGLPRERRDTEHDAPAAAGRAPPDTQKHGDPGSHTVAQLLMSGVCIEVLESHELGLSVNGGVGGIVGVLPSTKDPLQTGGCRFLALGSTSLDLGSFLAGSLFAGDDQLPTPPSMLVDFEDATAGWTVLAPLEVEDEADQSGDFSTSGVDGWSDIDSVAERSRRRKRKKWRGSCRISYKESRATITSSVLTLWVNSPITCIVSDFVDHAATSYLDICHIQVEQGHSPQPSSDVSDELSTSNLMTPTRERTRKITRMVVEVSLESAMIHVGDKLGASGHDVNTPTVLPHGVLLSASHVRLVYQATAPVPVEELERLHGPFARTACQVGYGTLHRASSVEVTVKDIRASIQVGSGPGSTTNCVLESCGLHVCISTREHDGDALPRRFISTRVDPLHVSFTAAQVAVLCTVAHYFTEPVSLEAVPFCQSYDDCRLLADFGDMSLTKIDGGMKDIMALESCGLTISTQVRPNDVGRVVLSSGYVEVGSDRPPFIRVLVESRRPRQQFESEDLVPSGLASSNFVLIFVESVVTVCTAALAKWVQHTMDLCCMHNHSERSGASLKVSRGPHKPQTRVSGIEELRRTALQVDVAPVTIFLPAVDDEGPEYFSRCVAHHNALLSPADSFKRKDNADLDEADGPERPHVLPPVFDELVFRIPKIEVRACPKVPYFTSSGSLTGVLPSEAIGMSLPQSCFPWRLRVIGFEVLSTAVAVSKDHSLVLSLPCLQVVVTDGLVSSGDHTVDRGVTTEQRDKLATEQMHVQVDLNPITSRVNASHAEVLVAILDRFRSTNDRRPLSSPHSSTVDHSPAMDVWVQIGIPRIDVTLETRARQTISGEVVEDRIQLLVEDAALTLHQARKSLGLQFKIGGLQVSHAARRSGAVPVRGAPIWRPTIGDGRLFVMLAGSEPDTVEHQSVNTHAALFASYTHFHDRRGVSPAVRLRVVPVHIVAWLPCLQNVADMFTGSPKPDGGAVSRDSPVDERPFRRDSQRHVSFPRIRCEMKRIRLTVPVRERVPGFEPTTTADTDDCIVVQLASLTVQPEVEDQRTSSLPVPASAPSSDGESESHASFGLRDLPADFELTATVEGVTMFSSKLDNVLSGRCDAEEADLAVVDKNPALRWNVHATRNAPGHGRVRTVVSPLGLRITIAPQGGMVTAQHHFTLDVVGEAVCFISSAQCCMCLDIMAENFNPLFKKRTLYKKHSAPPTLAFDTVVALPEISLVLYELQPNGVEALLRVLIERPQLRVVPKTFNTRYKLALSCTDINVRSVAAGRNVSLDKLLRHRSPVQTDVYCPLQFGREQWQKDDVAINLVVRDGDEHESFEMAVQLQVFLPLQLSISASFLSRCSTFASPIIASASRFAVRTFPNEVTTRPDDDIARYLLEVETQRTEIQYCIESAGAHQEEEGPSTGEVHAISCENLRVRSVSEESADATVSADVGIAFKGLQSFFMTSHGALVHYMQPTSGDITLRLEPTRPASPPRVLLHLRTPSITLNVGPRQILAANRALTDARERVQPIFAEDQAHGAAEFKNTDDGDGNGRGGRYSSVRRPQGLMAQLFAFKHCKVFDQSQLPSKLMPGQMGCFAGTMKAFGGDFAHAIVWRYMVPHHVDEIRMRVASSEEDSIQPTQLLRGVLQYWDPFKETFVFESTINNLVLGASCTVPVHGSTAAAIWRLVVHGAHRMISPTAIGNNLCIMSAPRADIAPKFSFSCDINSVRVDLFNSLPRDTFHVETSLSDCQIGVLDFEKASLEVRQWESGSMIVSIQTSARGSLVDPRNLRLTPFLALDGADISVKELAPTAREGRSRSAIDIAGRIESATVTGSQHAAALLQLSVDSWKHLLKSTKVSAETQPSLSVCAAPSSQISAAVAFVHRSPPGFGVFVVENCSQLHVRVGQIGTREAIDLPVGSICPYSLVELSDQRRISVHFSGRGESSAWSDAVDLDTNGTRHITIDAFGTTADLFVEVSALLGVYKYVCIRGAIQVRSLLDEELSVTIGTSKSDPALFSPRSTTIKHDDPVKSFAVPNTLLYNMELTVSWPVQDRASSGKEKSFQSTAAATAAPIALAAAPAAADDPAPAKGIPEADENMVDLRGQSRTIGIQLREHHGACSVQLLALPERGLQFCCTVKRTDTGQVEVLLHPAVRIRNYSRIPLCVALGPQFVSSNTADIDVGDTLNVTFAQNSAMHAFVQLGNSSEEKAAEWSKPITLWKNSFDVVHFVEKWHRDQAAVTREPIVVWHTVEHVLKIVTHVVGSVYTIDIIAPLHIINKSSYDLKFHASCMLSAQTVPSASATFADTHAVFDATCGLSVDVSMALASGSCDGDGHPTRQCTVTINKEPDEVDTESRSSDNACFASKDLHFALDANIFVNLVINAKFCGPTLVLCIEDWLSIESTSLRRLCIHGAKKKGTWDVPTAGNTLTVPWADEILSDQEQPVLKGHLCIHAEDACHDSQWTWSRAVPFGTPFSRYPVVIPSTHHTSVPLVLRTSKSADGVTRVRIVDDEHPRWIVQNKTKFRIRVFFDDTKYSIAPQSISHMTQQVDGSSINLDMPAARHRALVTLEISAGQPPGPFRVDLTKLGTSTLLCGGHHVWYRVEMQFASTILSIFDAPPPRLGEQHLRVRDGGEDQFSLRLDVGKVALELVDTVQSQAFSTPILRVMCSALHVWVSHSPENDPRWSQGELQRVEVRCDDLWLDIASLGDSPNVATYETALWSGDKASGVASGDSVSQRLSSDVKEKHVSPFLVVRITWFVPNLANEDVSAAVCVRNLDLEVDHINAFVNATAIADLVKRMGDFVGAVRDSALASPWDEGRASTTGRSDDRAVPHLIERLSISGLRATVSAKASVGVYVSVDDAVLNFGGICAESIFCSSQGQMWKAVGARYTSEAVFQAGWLVGSLGILGNPLGLARSIGAGVRDLVLKPIHGLSAGAPGGFLGGLNSGATSFLENVGHGAFGSISSFASSVVHNVPAPVEGVLGAVASTAGSLMSSVGLVAAAAPAPAVDDDERYRHQPSFSRFQCKVFPSPTNLVATLDCTGIARSGSLVKRTLLLTNTAIHVYSQVDDKIQQSFRIDDVAALERDASDPQSLTIGLAAVDDSSSGLGHRRAASENFLPQLLQTTQLYRYSAPVDARDRFETLFLLVKRKRPRGRHTRAQFRHRRTPSNPGHIGAVDPQRPG